MSFASLGLSDLLLRAIDEQGYTTPTPIQSQAIPAILAGRDIRAAAQTGTGKTAGFTLPLLQRLEASQPNTNQPSAGRRSHCQPVRALILTPTRELAAQVADSVATYGKHLSQRSAVVFGGVKINPQIAQLKQGVDILIATPGRLLDLCGQGILDLSRVEILVLDEADRMLDMGFIHDIRRVFKLLPAKRQNLLFSATFSTEIVRLTDGLLNDPVNVEVAVRNSTVAKIEQRVHLVDKTQKPNMLSHLIQEHAWHQVLIFTRTKHGANRLAQKLERDGIKSAAIHGNKSQGARTRALADFKENRIQALVATDIAARGLDIDQLPHVVNFELPNVAEDYVHRIGRTGRAGATGLAVSLVSPDERSLLRGIERLIKANIPTEVVTGFTPGPVTEQPADSTFDPRNRRPQNRKPSGNHSGNRGATNANARPQRSSRRHSSPNKTAA